jgi:quercetin dioxygenase-like cupin family protein
VAEGICTTEILYLAQALPCDLIVMGSHGRTGLSRLLAGSVAEEVLRKATCPVMVVRTPLSPTQQSDGEASAKAGEIVDVRPLGERLALARTKTVAKADGLEVIRLVVPAKKALQEQKTKGITVLHCLEGRVSLAALGGTRNLLEGELLHLPRGEPYTVRGIEDASLLMTVLLPRP